MTKELKERSKLVMLLGRELGACRRLFPLQSAHPWEKSHCLRWAVCAGEDL